jgi:hypothetical protein
VTAQLLTIHDGRAPVCNPKVHGKPPGTVSLAMVRRQRAAAHFRQQRDDVKREAVGARIEELVATVNLLKSKVSRYETLSRLPTKILADLHLSDARADAEYAAEHLVSPREAA